MRLEIFGGQLFPFMATLNFHHTFEFPKFRHLLATIVVLWLIMVCIIILTQTIGIEAIDFTDPLFDACSYLILFGGSSYWLFRQYQRQGIDLQSLLGFWPSTHHWRAVVGLWMTLFMFSFGAFQVSFILLSFLFPQFVESTLQETIFLTSEETALPWLYNLLTFFLLAVAAPLLEEFLFRGFLLHRWGTRWNPRTAVVLSSALFGILHSNVVGLTAFGLAMALLYLRSNSLILVIGVHSLNNAVAASLEILMRFTGSWQESSLANFRASVWLGCLLLVISLPFLVTFIQTNWPATRSLLPYFVNRDRQLQP